MSNTSAWKDRLAKHRYSQDERALQWKFEKEIGPKIEAFLDNAKEQTFTFGTYNLEIEPWRMAAALSFRKYNLKILESEVHVDPSKSGGAAQPASQLTNQPATQPAAQPASQPAAQPAAQPTATEITLVKQKLSKTIHC
jgi:hypothetical protein